MSCSTACQSFLLLSGLPPLVRARCGGQASLPTNDQPITVSLNSGITLTKPSA
jgi:hypothetical protein